MSKYMCNIKVVGGSGKGVKAKIGGQVAGSFGGHVTGGYTNGDGHGVLQWSGSMTLDTVYVDGKGHKGKYQSGETYVFRK